MPRCEVAVSDTKVSAGNVRRVAAESLVSAQGHHLVELTTQPTRGVVPDSSAFRAVLQASDALEQQVTLIDLFGTEGNIHPLFVGQNTT